MPGGACVRAWAIGAAVTTGACLDPNPAFDGPASSSSSGVAGSATSEGEGEGSSSGGAMVCTPDGYEPNEVESAQVPFGTFSLVLETIDAVDKYNVWLAPEVPELLTVTAIGDVRTCAFIKCESSLDPAQVDCTTGLSGGDPDGTPGCCGGPAVALSFVCGGDTSAKAVIVIDQAPADCTSYELEVVNG